MNVAVLDGGSRRGFVVRTGTADDGCVAGDQEAGRHAQAVSNRHLGGGEDGRSRMAGKLWHWLAPRSYHCRPVVHRRSKELDGRLFLTSPTHSFDLDLPLAAREGYSLPNQLRRWRGSEDMVRTVRGSRRSGTAALVVTRAGCSVDYLDSKLCFTYLLPAARSWEQNDDHLVFCFVTTTGAKLTSSVKGSKT